jgi:hypothetical protein
MLLSSKVALEVLEDVRLCDQGFKDLS